MTAAYEIQLTRTINAAPVAGDFQHVETPMPECGDGEVLIRVIYLSLDPYVGSVLRGRHMGEKQPGPGDPIPGHGLGQVIKSKADGFAVGEYVAGETGWRSHAVMNAKNARKINPDAAPLSANLGVAGMPGLTAYAGVYHLAKISGGENVFISSAAGAVGGTAGQLARIMGAKRVIGVAGSDEKCRLVKDEYGFDECINYKTGSWKDDVANAFPNGIDVYFDNVGGDLLMTALLNLANYGRVVLCGLASQYHVDDRPAGPNPGLFIGKRAQLFGLVVYDYYDEQAAYARKAGAWIKEGKLVFLEDRAEGLAAAPALFEKLVKGENVGKCIVAVAAEQA